MTLPKVTLILPLYQPSPESLAFVERVAEEATDHVVVLVLDNGCVPPLREGWISKITNHWNARNNRVDDNQGWGGAIVLGARMATTPYVAWAPTNGKLSSGGVLNFIQTALASEAEFAKASRVGRSSIFRIKAQVAGLFHSMILRTPMWDSGGTPTFCKRSFFLQEFSWPQGAAFDAFVLFQALRSGIPVHRITVGYMDFPAKQSSWRKGLGSEILLFLQIARFGQVAGSRRPL